MGAEELCAGGVRCVPAGAREHVSGVWCGGVLWPRSGMCALKMRYNGAETPWGGRTEAGVTPLHLPRWVMTTATCHSCQLLLTARALSHAYTHMHAH